MCSKWLCLWYKVIFSAAKFERVNQLERQIAKMNWRECEIFSQLYKICVRSRLMHIKAFKSLHMFGVKKVKSFIFLLELNLQKGFCWQMQPLKIPIKILCTYIFWQNFLHVLLSMNNFRVTLSTLNEHSTS